MTVRFIHIKKNGGTSAFKFLRKNGVDILVGDSKDRLMNQHSTVHYYLDEDSFKFSIVRNPYDRIISDILWLKFNDENASQEEIYDTIQNYYFNRDDIANHNKAQYLFITDNNGNLIPDITILKMENLTNNLRKIGFTDYEGPTHTKSYMKYLNKESIEIINMVYKYDFELFGYEMIHP